MKLIALAYLPEFAFARPPQKSFKKDRRRQVIGIYLREEIVKLFPKERRNMGQMQSKQAIALRQVSGTAIAKSGVVEVSALTPSNGPETLHGNSRSEGSAWETKVEIVRLPPHRDEPAHLLAEPYLGMTSDQFNEVLDVFPFFKGMRSPQDLGLLFAMWLNCDPCSGVWWGNASELAQGTTLKSAYRSLLAMKDGEFINYAPEHLSEDFFPVLLHEYPVRRGPLKGHVLNAFPANLLGIAAYDVKGRGASAGSTNRSDRPGTLLVTRFKEGKVYVKRMNA